MGVALATTLAVPAIPAGAADDVPDTAIFHHADGIDLRGCGLGPGPELEKLGYRFPLAEPRWEVGAATTPCPALTGGFVPDLDDFCRIHNAGAVAHWLPDGRPICRSPDYVPDAAHAPGYWMVLPAACTLMFPDQSAIRRGQLNAAGELVGTGRLYPVVKMRDRTLECFYLEVPMSTPTIADSASADTYVGLLGSIREAASPSGTYVPCGDTAAVRFQQTSHEIDGVRHELTAWARAHLFYRSAPDVGFRYLNLTVDDIPVFRDLPLRSGETSGLLIDFNLWFPLGVTEGTRVDSLDYVCSLTDHPLVGAPDKPKSPPPGKKPAKVDLTEIAVATVIFKDKIVKFKGPQEEDDRQWYPYGPDIKASAFHGWTTFANQECDRGECFPAAVSNSLKMLKDLHPKTMKEVTDDPKSTSDETDIKRIKVWTHTRSAFGSGEYSSDGGMPSGRTNDPEAGWNLLKAVFDSRTHIPIETELVDDPKKLKRILELIKDKQDCELIANSHAVMITGVIELRDGSYLFEVADDTEQGKPGGTHVQLLHYNPVKNQFRGHPTIAGAKMTPGAGKTLFVCHKVVAKSK
jgi:hypothetical protein